MIAKAPRPDTSPLPPLLPAKSTAIFPLLPWIGLVVGSALIVYAYARASVVFHTQEHYHLFWLGVIAFLAPTCIRLLSADATRTERLWLLMAVGAFNFLPKFLRDPQGPLFHDELGHWRQAEVIYSTGKSFQPNPVVPIMQYFPGLHTVTAALRDLTGLSTFQVGSLLILLLHAIALVGVFVVAEELTHDARVASVASFIYSLNASFMFFDSQYSYESLAFVLFIWVVAIAVRTTSIETVMSDRIRWAVLAVILGAACVITHHLTSYSLVVALLLIVGFTWMKVRSEEQYRSTAILISVLALVVAAMSALWLIFVASRVIGYLSPSLQNGIRPLFNLLTHDEQARTLFVHSVVPPYERIFAFLAPILVALGAAFGVWLLRVRRRPPALSALVLFGLLYFPSVPLLLTKGGAEGARRTWAFTYLGLAILIAPALVWLMDRSRTWSLGRRRTLPIVLAALMTVVLIGNVTTSMNDAYRFPGETVYGSDTRSLTPELRQTTQWFRDEFGTGQGVVADRYSALAFSSFGKEWTLADGAGFPTWDLFLSPSPTNPLLLGQLDYMGYRYLVIDKRMIHELPLLGFYVSSGEPQAGRRTAPPPAVAITKYDYVPWAIKVYESNSFEVFRLNFSAISGLQKRVNALARSSQLFHLVQVPSGQ